MCWSGKPNETRQLLHECEDVTVVTATIRIRNTELHPNDHREKVLKVLKDHLPLAPNDTVNVHVRRWAG